MKPIATDTNDFPSLRRDGKIYVDKTGFVFRMATDRDSRLFFMSRPRRVVFDGLEIDDTGLPENYEGPFVFGMFNEKNTSSDYVEKHPYHVTEEVELRNVTTKSGKPVRLSPNKWMFRNVKVVENGAWYPVDFTAREVAPGDLGLDASRSNVLNYPQRTDKIIRRTADA